MQNTLYCGDNLHVLREYIPDESVDLIYLDPPFKKNQSYNVLFQEKNGTQSPVKIETFEDTWHWDLTTEETWTEIVEKSPNRKLVNLMVAMRKFLGTNDMMAYLVMMAIRLQELHRVLKSTGSIYLHCDPTASHYLKLFMDSVFGGRNFQNEIIWHYVSLGHPKSRFSRNHDVILFYTKTRNRIFNQDDVRIPYNAKRLARATKDKNGNLVYVHGPGFSVTKVHPRGKVCDDVWFINIINSMAKERLGYPTQKPEALLERIIKASSNENNIVLDPFCGCGTTIVVAEKLKRKWIGIDITHLAIALMEYRLRDTFGDSVEYKVVGVPVSVKDAEDLAKRDRFQFQSWALSLVKAKPEPGDVADKGIDGRIYFHDDPKGKERKEIILQVKSGKVSRSMVRDLKGLVEREKAQIGVLITLRNPTRGMIGEAVSAGFYNSPGNKQYPRIQILTIEDLIRGEKIKRPIEGIWAIDRTFKRAKKLKEKQGEQKGLF